MPGAAGFTVCSLAPMSGAVSMEQFLGLVDWKEANVTEMQAITWWREHLAKDEARRK